MLRQAGLILSVLLLPLLAWASQRVGSVPDFAEFDSNASLRFHGNATVWENLTVNLETAKVPTVSAPSFDQFRNNTYAYNFSVGEVIYFTVQLPHSWTTGSTVYPHMHYSNAVAGNGTQWSQWQLEFTRASVNGTFGTSETMTAKDNIGTTSYEHKVLDFGALSMSNATLSNALVCRLSRQTATGLPVGDTNFPGDVFGLDFDFHYEVDALGSRTLYSK